MFIDPTLFTSGFDDDDITLPPPPPTVDLVVKDVYEPLFYSATWTLCAYVNGKIVSSSTPFHKPHSTLFIDRWVRRLLRSEASYMSSLGVDVYAEYEKWHGDTRDLDP